MWANVHFLESPQSEFWGQVYSVALGMIPKNMECLVIVNYKTGPIKRVFEDLKMLEHETSQLFNPSSQLCMEEEFYFSFMKGKFNWIYKKADTDFRKTLAESGVQCLSTNVFKAVSSTVPQNWSP
jgi:hypothetical protein